MDDDGTIEFDYTDVVTPIRAVAVPSEAFPDDTDPNVDACPGCGTRLVRIKSDERVPANGDEAARRFPLCAASRDDSWNWCVNGAVGEVRQSDGTMVLLLLE